MNVTKSEVSGRFGHIYLKKTLMENFIFLFIINTSNFQIDQNHGYAFRTMSKTGDHRCFTGSYVSLS